MYCGVNCGIIYIPCYLLKEGWTNLSFDSCHSFFGAGNVTHPTGSPVKITGGSASSTPGQGLIRSHLYVSPEPPQSCPTTRTGGLGRNLFSSHPCPGCNQVVTNRYISADRISPRAMLTTHVRTYISVIRMIIVPTSLSCCCCCSNWLDRRLSQWLEPSPEQTGCCGTFCRAYKDKLVLKLFMQQQNVAAA